MDKFELEMEEWNKAFHDKKDKKIAIYGSGRISATLLSRNDAYNIICVCDRNDEKVGEMIYGVPIAGRDFAERNADMLVINTSETYWNTIYERIKDWKLPIYYRNGERAGDKYQEADAYWSQSAEELEKQIEAHDIISFDIFGTLVVRKLFSDVDAFQITEQILRERQRDKGTDQNIPFVEIRKKAAGNLANPNYDEIYEEISRISGWGKSMVADAKRIEHEVDALLISPRKTTIGLYKKYKDKKSIYLVSDMYYTAGQLKQILKESGLEVPEEKILVSCDIKKAKAEGSLWEYYAGHILKGKKALHLGDDKKADIEIPAKYGIDGYLIRSPREMAEHSPLRPLLPLINSTFSSVCMGILLAKIFDDPFALNKSKGIVNFESNEEAGFSIWGMFLYVFFSWICDRARALGISSIAFFAREGYLLTPLFKEFIKLNKFTDLFTPTCLDISRRAVMIAAMQNPEDIKEAADFPYKGSLKDFFADRFNIAVDEDDEAECSYSEAKTTGLFARLIKKYEGPILDEAGRERRNYIKYCSEVLGGSFVTVDSQLTGSTQYFLSKLLKRKIPGLYMAANTAEENPYSRENEMYGCYGGKAASIFRYAPFTESFMTAPHGMLLYMDENCNPVYEEKKENQINFSIREQMKEGISLYLQEAAKLICKMDLKISQKDIELADKLFDCWMKNGFVKTGQMKKSFFYDNGLAGKGESAIWE